ncbi:regulator [Cupriavidus campinensis]|uniref:Regulator n=1 Tax=Cupriavidus campinensis TaxID=151783 RepID=A0ABY3ESQ8_9BURK|nr:regulator [Cupriavidus campinensis]TSP13997.1 regulator [Cupriavidus campinensis]
MDASKLMALMKDKKAAMQRREKTVKPAPGKTRIRLLPGWRKGEEHIWFHDFGQHFIKNEADEIQAVYLCANTTFGRPCAVCDGLAKAARMTHDDGIVQTLEKAKSSKSVLINALVLDSDSPNKPQILELRPGVFGQIVDIVSEWGPQVFDLDDGNEIVIERSGKGLTTKYSAALSPKKHPVPAAALKELNNLDEYVRQESEEQQRKALGAINSVAGLLPAAPAGSDTPRTSPAALPSTKSTDFEDVDIPDEVTMGAAAARPALTDDIDALLGDLD